MAGKLRTPRTTPIIPADVEETMERRHSKMVEYEVIVNLRNGCDCLSRLNTPREMERHDSLSMVLGIYFYPKDIYHVTGRYNSGYPFVILNHSYAAEGELRF